MTSPFAAVLFALEAFYQAFASRDLDAMDDLWDTQGPVSCIHPGWHPLSGRAEVMAAWQAILANTNTPKAEMVDVALHQHGGVVVATGFERIEGHHLAVTNVLVERNGRWLMVHHQAGPVAVQPEFEEPAPSSPDPLAVN